MSPRCHQMQFCSRKKCSCLSGGAGRSETPHNRDKSVLHQVGDDDLFNQIHGFMDPSSVLTCKTHRGHKTHTHTHTYTYTHAHRPHHTPRTQWTQTQQKTSRTQHSHHTSHSSHTHTHTHKHTHAHRLAQLWNSSTQALSQRPARAVCETQATFRGQRQ